MGRTGGSVIGSAKVSAAADRVDAAKAGVALLVPASAGPARSARVAALACRFNVAEQKKFRLSAAGLEGIDMSIALRKALVAGVITLIIAAGSATAPAFAFDACCHHGVHHRAFSHKGCPDLYAQVSSRWRPLGYGCGPFGDNADGWDIGSGGVCYYPYYGFPYGYGP
jgi:hypothetical protein